MILTPAEMAAAEARLFATGVEAEPLMDSAGAGIAAALQQFFPQPGTALAFVGDGHNGGDALVVARHLADADWRVQLRLVGDKDSLKPLTRKKLDELGDRATAWHETGARPTLVIDGLLGIGASGELRPAYAAAAKQIDSLRQSDGARVAAIDIPSGLDATTGEPYPGAVRADFTITVGYPKSGLITDAAAPHIGRIALVPLPQIVPCDGDGDGNALLNIAGESARLMPPRSPDAHKGRAGRVGIVAGSPGFTGAAVLASTAALRGGAGLVTLFARHDNYPALAAAAPPEVMVKPVESYAEIATTELDALAVGPGLGSGAWDDEVHQLLLHDPRPMVVDADALNLLARRDISAIAGSAGPRLLTPHPGEMARLDGNASSGRRERAENLAAATSATVLLKGALTVIASAESQPTVFNSTGNPGMASGGVGDTLTGLCAALAAGGLALHRAACCGAWLNGRAAEIAVSHGRQSHESLAASDLPTHFGAAFESLRRGDF
jgi:hydroxyethylthiazole kinase-like uncharacterized protein yjeF